MEKKKFWVIAAGVLLAVALCFVGLHLYRTDKRNYIGRDIENFAFIHGAGLAVFETYTIEKVKGGYVLHFEYDGLTGWEFYGNVFASDYSEEDITYFIPYEYEDYDQDSDNYKYYPGGGIEYEDILDEGGNYLRISKDIKLTKADMKKLRDIIIDQDIVSWNGFNQSLKGVVDDYGFSLEITYEDGSKITAQGYGKSPKNYNESVKVLNGFLIELTKR